MRTIALLSALVLTANLVGCGGSAPSVIGNWHADALPDNPPPGAASVTLIVNEDQTFSAALDNDQGSPVAGFAGTWQPEGEQISFASTMPTITGRAQLLDAETLLVTSDDGFSLRMTRVKAP